MRIWYYNPALDSERKSVDVPDRRVLIGRSEHNHVVLNSPFVAEEAAVLTRGDTGWEIKCLGNNAIHVGPMRLLTGQATILESGQEIVIGKVFTLSLELPKITIDSAQARRRRLDGEAAEFIQLLHLKLLADPTFKAALAANQKNDDQQLMVVERRIDLIAREEGLLNPEREELVDHITGQCLRGKMLAEVTSGKSDSILTSDDHWSRLVQTAPDRERELEEIARHVGRELKLDQAADFSERADRVDRQFPPLWDKLKASYSKDLKQYLAIRYLKKEIKDILFGFGPLEDLLRLPTISEIMVVDSERIYVEKGGMLENSGRRFVSDEVTEAIIQRIVSKVNRRIDKASPLVDARLPDGSRVNAVIPPLAVSGPCLTIRKFPLRRLKVDDLVQRGALTAAAAKFLQAAVLHRANIIVAGGTGSGKTTLLNCLSDFIPDKERIVTVEDTAELQLAKEHVVRLETKAANVEGTGQYTIRDLVKNALRMRPDRIVVGECRGPEALDMLQAMNTGHDGSLTTLHANNAEDVILRLEVLVQLTPDAKLPIESIHRQIVSAVDLIVQLHRCRNGKRVISQISEVVDLDPDTHQVRLRDLFLRPEENDDGVLAPTGSLPTFLGELIDRKMIDLETFYT